MLCGIAAVLFFPLHPSRGASDALDPRALRALVDRAAATHSDALVVVRRGRLVGSWSFGQPARPLAVTSISKSVCALAAGMLLDDGKIRLDESMGDFVPAWRPDGRRAITVRQILSMTSGLADPYSAYFRLDRDLQGLAMRETLARSPGSAWRYDNTSVNLIDTIVRRTTGRDVKRFLDARLFEPLGIEAGWRRDGAGNVPCASGLALRPRDLARIGEVVANGGIGPKGRILSAATIGLLTRPSQPFEPRYGMLWWVVYSRGARVIDPQTFRRWEEAGVRPDILAKARPVVGRAYPEAEFNTRLRSALSPFRVEDLDLELRRTEMPAERFIPGGNPSAAWALGDGGQKLYVSQADGLVVVRLISPGRWHGSEDDFFDFLGLVRALTKKG